MENRTVLYNPSCREKTPVIRTKMFANVGSVSESQHDTFGTSDPIKVARRLIPDVAEAAEKMTRRFDSTHEDHPNDEALQIKTALEELRKVQESAAWATRMLIELTGKARRENRKWPSQRKMVEASGVSLASIHEWIHHPAPIIDGQAGPGTLAKPGQTRHRFTPGGSDYDTGESDHDTDETGEDDW